MKKIKVMLLSLALLTVVGGALAFKAKFGGLTYCTADLGINGTCNFSCPTFDDRITTTEPVEFVCTTDLNSYTYGSQQTSSSFGCVRVPGWQEGNYNTSTLPCNTSLEVKHD